MATTTLGNKSTGSIIKLKENGTLVDFYVAKHDYFRFYFSVGSDDGHTFFYIKRDIFRYHEMIVKNYS